MTSPAKKTTSSTASFFFRAKPKKLLSEVKRVLDNVETIEVIDSDDDGGDGNDGIGDRRSKRPRKVETEIGNVEREITIIEDEPRKSLSKVKKHPPLPAISSPAPETSNVVPVLTNEPTVPGSPNAPISKLYKTHCKERKLNFYSIILTCDGVRLFASATPASLGVHSGSISVKNDYHRSEKEQALQREALLAVATDNTELWQHITPKDTLHSAESLDCPSEWTLNIKSSKTEPIQIRANPHEPLQSSALDSIRTQLHIPSNRPLKLVFDGMTLDLTQTPVQLQLEDDDLLELLF
ncbi:hypothetical protein PSACC_02196 [Paramicrosporidium saccamoebae]|uniref:Rad60/SUMO-like domain-containing protein n=1 Tax=Paramicrosporidium saccamoebae TaxID=1246581 RepID=A0A2H9TJI8_9FUNG|nr:hypothetical protein PSACC_02196 [Paramicrosporidium saccamoebae]